MSHPHTLMVKRDAGPGTPAFLKSSNLLYLFEY